MEHAQKCFVGPYRIRRHDGLKELMSNCLKQATTTHSVLLEVPIKRQRIRANAANNNQQNAASRTRDARMDIRVTGLRGVGAVDDIDVRISHLDSRTYVAAGASVEELFEEHHIKPKRAAYENACRRLGHKFTPFVVSTDGVMSEPAKDFVKLLANKTAEKWGMTGAGRTGVLMATLRAKIGMAIVRGSSACIRGERERACHYVERREVALDGEAGEELRYVFSSQASQRPG